MFNYLNPTTQISFPKKPWESLQQYLTKHAVFILIFLLSVISISCWLIFYKNGLGLAYNDARSHLDIGRRVVEGLKPGMAQLGSVWLPLPHILMVLTIWNDFMWHSGLSGAIQSMISFVATGYLIYKILEKLKVGMIGRIVGVGIFITNLNILYLQSTAMTELLLIFTMTIAVYELLNYHEDDSILSLVKTAFWIMLSTLIRYDGWFLFLMAAILVTYHGWKRKSFAKAEGVFVLFCSLAGLGIFLWVVWNAAIFKDPLYFAFGPYSAHAQQLQLADAGVLITQKNWMQSISTYWYAMIYNSGTFTVLLSFVGAAILLVNKKISPAIRLASLALLAPLIFNIIALYFGFSVLFIQGLNGNTWFNVRYGVMMVPSIAIFVGILIDKLKGSRWILIGLLLFVTFFSLVNFDAVTVDDGRVGSSQKNVSEVSTWLHDHAANTPGFVLISAASHDAIIFSSGLPMKKYIHEGTGTYWLNATTEPDRWARWIVMRTNDNNDQTFKLVSKSGQLFKYTLVKSYPFADIYELKPEYFSVLNTQPVLGNQK